MKYKEQGKVDSQHRGSWIKGILSYVLLLGGGRYSTFERLLISEKGSLYGV